MGVDLERFAPPGDASLTGHPLRVLSVARLVAEKGVEDLVIAMRLLRDAGSRRADARRRGAARQDA